jgi:hypothetical protein
LWAPWHDDPPHWQTAPLRMQAVRWSAQGCWIFVRGDETLLPCVALFLALYLVSLFLILYSRLACTCTYFVFMHKYPNSQELISNHSYSLETSFMC